MPDIEHAELGSRMEFHLSGEQNQRWDRITANGEDTEIVKGYLCEGSPPFKKLAWELVYRGGKPDEERLDLMEVTDPAEREAWIRARLP